MFSRTMSIRAAGTVLFLALTAAADPISYGDYLGTGSGEVDFIQVIEEPSTYPTALFESPTRTGNKLIFAPSAFGSYSAGGSSDSVYSTLSVTIRADTGYTLETIELEELGDYLLTGLGTSATSAHVYGTLSAENTATHTSYTDTMTVLPTSPYTLPSDSFGAFSGSAIIDLTGLDISEVELVFCNTLETSSEAMTTSLIQKKDIELTVTTVPEPASVLLLTIGFAMARRRRR
jgi:hypothetical protein